MDGSPPRQQTAPHWHRYLFRSFCLIILADVILINGVCLAPPPADYADFLVRLHPATVLAMVVALCLSVAAAIYWISGFALAFAAEFRRKAPGKWAFAFVFLSPAALLLGHWIFRGILDGELRMLHRSLHRFWQWLL